MPPGRRRPRRRPAPPARSDVVSGGGYKPKPKPKPKPAPKAVSDVRSSGPGGYNNPKPQPGPAPPAKSDVVSGGGYKPKPQPWVIRRQRALRAAGFSVVVDGVWGLASQRAWNQYRHGKPVIANAAADEAAAHRRFSHALHQVVTDAKNRAPSTLGGGWKNLLNPDKIAREEKQLRADAVRREVAQARQAAQRARSLPLRQVSVHDLVALTIDPVTGRFDPQHPADVRRVQSWLRAHGHALTVDGVFGKQTFKALVGAYQHSITHERAQAIDATVDRYYSSGLLKPGSPAPSGFPLATVPKPGELAKLLHEGGFTADVTVSWLEHRLHRDPLLGINRAFVQGARSYLQRRTREGERSFRAPFLPYETPELIRRYGARGAAVLSAPNPDALKQQLVEIRRAERAYVQELRRKAHSGGGWVGSIVHVLSVPGEFMREQVVAAGLAFFRGGRGLAAGVGGPSFGSALGELGLGYAGLIPGLGQSPGYLYGSRRVRSFEDDLLRARLTLSEFRDRHPWWSLGVELVFDPTNGIPGKVFVLPFKGAWRGVELVERAGIALTASGRVGRIPIVLAAPAFLGRSSFGHLDDAVRGFSAALEHSARLSPAERGLLRPLTKTYISYKHATALKQTLADAARRSVSEAQRRYFRPAATGAASARAVRTGAAEFDRFDYKLGNELGGEYYAHSDEFLKHATKPLRELERDFVAKRVSLYSSSAGATPSTVGYHLVARQSEEIRVWALEYTARRDAHFYALGQVSKRYPEAVLGEQESRRLVGEPPKAIQALYDKEYEFALQEARNKFGTHLEGGVDDEFDAKVRATRRELMDRFEMSVLPALQRRLELAAQEAGVSLFDEQGLWVGVGGSAEDYFRAAAGDGFYEWTRQVSVPNPRFGKVYSQADFEQMFEEEVARRQRMVKARIGVSRASGRSAELGEDELDKIERDVFKAWERNGDGAYTDTRERIYVPAMYAGPEAAPLRATPSEGLVTASTFTPTPLDLEMRELPSWLGASPGFSPGRGGDLKAALEKAEWVQLVTRQTELARQAENLAYSQALYKHGLFLAAMGTAQKAPLRWVYKGFTGATVAWKFATLPLRPAWVVRNTADNTIKTLLAATRDPRYLLAGAETPGKGLQTIFDVGLYPLRQAVSFLDQIFGTDALHYFDAALDKFWHFTNERVLAQVFAGQGVPIPEAMIRESRFARYAAAEAGESEAFYARWYRGIWDLMGTRPEAYYKRVIYRRVYEDVLQKTGDELAAGKAAWERVESTLFDYSKVSAVEDNFKLFFPFIQFWRKNTQFWVRQFAQKPWFLLGVARFEQGFQDRHDELPSWMRRYASLKEVADVAASVPGLSWMADSLADMQTDPLNFTSFAPLYRAFKNSNPLLPADRAGMAFIAPMVDAFNQWGLGMNPLFRKPLEVAGVLNYRAWQHIFPQTDLIRIFTKGHWADWFRKGLDLELFLDPLYEQLGLQSQSELDAKAFNTYVQMEMTGQLARGEDVSRSRAEDKIRQFLAVQTLVGYFFGVYGRRATPEDIYLYQLTEVVHEGGFEGLTRREQDLYRTWRLRKFDALTFDRYLEAVPLIRGYYRLTGRDREQFLQDNPEILPYVRPHFSYRLGGQRFAQTVALIADTRSAIEMVDFLKIVDAPYELRKRMEQAFITPELRDFWRRNDTPRQLRDKMLRGELFGFLRRLNDTYNAIPETDFEARSAFLDDHPMLVHWWLSNNSSSDDYKAVIDSTNATLRERYFEIVDRDGFAAASGFLRRFPFIFEFTRAASKVDPETGEWIRRGGRGRGFVHGFSHRHGLSQHARDYLAAKPYLDHFFYILNHGSKQVAFDWLYSKDKGASVVRSYFATYSHHSSGGTSQHARDFLKARSSLTYFFDLVKRDKTAAYDWLDSSKPGAKIVREYFAKYARQSKSEHAQAYVKAQRWLKFYFGLPSDRQREWLHGSSAGAKVVRDYFDRWAGSGPGEQAQDYRRAKRWLRYYYDLPASKQHAWLHGDSPGAVVVLAYFNKWSKLNQLSRKWGGYLRGLDPELNRRLQFWQRYWQLPPDERIQFVLDKAASYGVFVWGQPGDEARHAAESEFLRKAIAHTHLDQRTLLYLRVRPLLDLLYTLPSSERKLFTKANPELQEYLDKYGGGSPTGDKRLDAELEGYFKLPSDSAQRSAYLKAHPHVQRYFDAHSTPATRAIHRLLEVYFSLPVSQRPEFGTTHPEIGAFFDKRKAEKDNEAAQLAAFEQADPRLEHVRQQAKAEEQRTLHRLRVYQDELRRRAEDSVVFTRRRKRKPLAGSPTNP